MRRVLLAALVLGFPAAAAAQLSPSAAWAAHAANQYQVAANITYLTASNYEAKLDVYSRRGATTPQPTVIYFHGGFWAAGSKEGSLMSLLPWMEMGWNVVNVEYRLARIAPAPAAVEDCLCALRFIAAQAKTYNIDLNRIVLTGESAGGHLTLTTGMIPESSGLARECAGNTPDSARGGDGQLVRYYGRRRRDRRSACRESRGDLAGQPAEQGRDREACVAVDVGASRSAADPDDSRRSGSARAVRRGGAPARRADEGRRHQSAADDPGGARHHAGDGRRSSRPTFLGKRRPTRRDLLVRHRIRDFTSSL